MQPISIDIAVDLSCPWCFIGKRTLEAALNNRPHINPRLRWSAFLLNPHLDDDGVGFFDHMALKFGSDANIARTLQGITQIGRSCDIAFDFANIETVPNTRHAHRLLAWAQDNCGPDVAFEMIEALFCAYFLDGRDIGKIGNLCDIAAEQNLNAENIDTYLSSSQGMKEVESDNARIHRLGLNGVPAFIFNGHNIISGAQPRAVLERMLDVGYAETGADHQPRVSFA